MSFFMIHETEINKCNSYIYNSYATAIYTINNERLSHILSRRVSTHLCSTNPLSHFYFLCMNCPSEQHDHITWLTWCVLPAPWFLHQHSLLQQGYPFTRSKNKRVSSEMKRNYTITFFCTTEKFITSVSKKVSARCELLNIFSVL